MGGLENGDSSHVQLLQPLNHLVFPAASGNPAPQSFFLAVHHTSISSAYPFPHTVAWLNLSLLRWQMPCDNPTLAVSPFLTVPCHYSQPYPCPEQGDRLVQISCPCTITREAFPRKLCQGSDQVHFQAASLPYLPGTYCEFCE